MSVVRYLAFQLNGSAIINKREHKVLFTCIGFWITLMTLRSVISGKANHTTSQGWSKWCYAGKNYGKHRKMRWKWGQRAWNREGPGAGTNSVGFACDYLGKVGEEKGEKKDSNPLCRKGPHSIRICYSNTAFTFLPPFLPPSLYLSFPPSFLSSLPSFLPSLFFKGAADRHPHFSGMWQ